MLRSALIFVCLFFCAVSFAQTGLFDNDWRFHLGDTAGAEKTDFNDKNWRTLNLPHDWSIEDRPDTLSPFGTASVGGVNTGFAIGGTSWYRKTFEVPAFQTGKPAYLQFDGVYMNADVWINGQHLGNHPYGYTSFYYNLAPYLKAGKNTVAVQVKNEGKNSRWYSGSGIYRHVWLKYTELVHIATWGTYITTKNVKAASAIVVTETQVQNESKAPASVSVTTKILNPKGVQVAINTIKSPIVPTDSNSITKQEIIVAAPQLWSVETPTLYTAVTEVYDGKKLLSTNKTTFGIRTISFSADRGFQLNGKTVKLKGGCVHHEHGPLGAASFDRAEERKIEILKAAGYNAVRTSHNPPSPAFLDACDRLGMLIIDEAFDTWRDKKNKEDYNLWFTQWWQRDIESMVVRDRNHPSIIMWSIGNEIPNRDKPEVVAVADSLHKYINLFDTTRPVTCGVNGVEENKDPFFSKLDIAGYNYAPDKYVPDNQRLPARIMYASESFAIEAYVYWKEVEAHPYVIGDFVWTAWDYIGEASIGWLGYPQKRDFFPWNLAYCGDIDVCGWKRPQSYYRDVLWKKNQLSIWVAPPKPTFPLPTFKQEPWAKWNWQDVQANWTWPGYEDSTLAVTAYVNADEVELFLNNKSLGKKGVDTASHYQIKWMVPYSAGVLKAVSYTKGKIANTSILKTAQAATQIQLSADRKTIKASEQDLSYITINLTDAKGIINPAAENLLQFSITGPGKIVGVGNANPMSLESFKSNQRKAWQGKCLVIVQSTGKAGTINLTVKGDGLKKAVTSIVAK